ncbi:MAG: TonB C-terminal domain-containing protein [Bdellovibrionales bacterium]|nr:TonB C-terminal domain-containing protein [Bdellovibrionales bacterium]
MLRVQPTPIFLTQAKNPLSEKDLIEIAEAESILGERVVPEADSTNKLVSTEQSENIDTSEVHDQLSDRTQSVEKQSRAPIGKEFFAGDPLASGGSEESLHSLGLMPDIFSNGDLSSSSDKHAAPDFEIRVGSTRDEYLEGIEGGARTVLNTEEFAHWIYFDRIKQKIAPRWRPEVQRRTRALAMSRRKLEDGIKRTKVYVELDRDGKIIDLAVVKSSRSGYLDEAAVKAFKDVGRFPNPPHELLKNDRIRFSWNFVIDINEKRLAKSIRKPQLRERLENLN